MRQDEYNHVSVINEGENFRHEFTSAQKSEYSDKAENRYDYVDDINEEKVSNEGPQKDKEEERQKEKQVNQREEENKSSLEKQTIETPSSSTGGGSSSSSSSSASSSGASSSSAASSASAVSSTVATAASVIAVASVSVAAGVSVMQNMDAKCTFQDLQIFTDRIEYALVLENTETDNFVIKVNSKTYENQKPLTNGENNGEFIGLNEGETYSILVMEDTFGGKTLYDGEFTTQVTPDVSEVYSIEIESMPSKTIYSIGEEFDPTGLAVKATYTDGQTVAVETSQLEFSGFDTTSSGSKTVTVTYENQSTTFHVFVKTYEFRSFSINPEYDWDTQYFEVSLDYTDVDSQISTFKLTVKDLTTSIEPEEGYEYEYTWSIGKPSGTKSIQFILPRAYDIHPEDELEFTLSALVNEESVNLQTISNFHFNEAPEQYGVNSIDTTGEISTNSTITVNIQMLGENHYRNMYIRVANGSDIMDFTVEVRSGEQQIKVAEYMDQLLSGTAYYVLLYGDVMDNAGVWQENQELKKMAGTVTFFEGDGIYAFKFSSFELDSRNTFSGTLSYNNAKGTLPQLGLNFVDQNPNSSLYKESSTFPLQTTEDVQTFDLSNVQTASGRPIIEYLNDDFFACAIVDFVDGDVLWTYPEIVQFVPYQQRGITGISSQNNYEISEQQTIDLMVSGYDPEGELTGDLRIVFSNVNDADMVIKLEPFKSNSLNVDRTYDLSNIDFTIADLINNTFVVSVEMDDKPIYESSAQISFSYAGQTEATIEDFVSDDNFLVDSDKYFHGHLFNISDPIGELKELQLNFKDISEQSDFYNHEFSFALDIHEDQQDFDLNGIVDNYNIFDYLPNDSFELTVVDVILGKSLLTKNMQFNYTPDTPSEISASFEIDQTCAITEDLIFEGKLVVDDPTTQVAELTLRFIRQADGQDEATFDLTVAKNDWNSAMQFNFSVDYSIDDFDQQIFNIIILHGTDILWNYHDENQTYMKFVVSGSPTTDTGVSLSIPQQVEFTSDLAFTATLNVDTSIYTGSIITMRLTRVSDGYTYTIRTTESVWNQEKEFSLNGQASISDLKDQTFDIILVDSQDEELWSYYEANQMYVTFVNNNPVTPSDDYLNGFANTSFIINETEGNYSMPVQLDISNHNETYTSLQVTFTAVTATTGTAFTVVLNDATGATQEVDMTKPWELFGETLYRTEFDWTISGLVNGVENDSIISSQNPITFIEGSSGGSEASGIFNTQGFFCTWEINEENIMQLMMDYTEDGEFFSNFILRLYPQDEQASEERYFDVPLEKTTSVQDINMYSNVPEMYTELYGSYPFKAEIYADTPEEASVLQYDAGTINFVLIGQAEPTFTSWSSDFVLDAYHRMNLNLVYDDLYGKYDHLVMVITSEDATSVQEFSVTITDFRVGEDNVVDLTTSIEEEVINNTLLDESKTFTIKLYVYRSGSQQGEEVGLSVTGQHFTSTI